MDMRNCQFSLQDQSFLYTFFIYILIFLIYYFDSFQSIEESVDKLKDSTEIQVFTCNVCRLLACVADCIQTDVESGQSSFPDNLVTEWNEFFSEGIYGVLLPLFLKIAG